MAIHIRGQLEKDIRELASKLEKEKGIKLSGMNCVRTIIFDFNKDFDNNYNNILNNEKLKNVKNTHNSIQIRNKNITIKNTPTGIKITDENYFKIYYKNNKVRILDNNKTYVRNKRRTNISFKIRSNLNTRIVIAIRDQSGKKHTSTMSYVGCTLEQFKKHLELQFKDNMKWENYGSLWHIDHCIPCAHFDLTIPEQQKECFHYTNMKPMLASLNVAKGARYAEPKILDTVIN